MKVVKVDKKILLIKSVIGSVVAALYCMFWTIFDPPKSYSNIEVTDDMVHDKDGLSQTVVLIFSHCESRSLAWYNVSFMLQGLLLIGGSFLIYSSMIILILRFVAHFIGGALETIPEANYYL